MPRKSTKKVLAPKADDKIQISPKDLPVQAGLSAQADEQPSPENDNIFNQEGELVVDVFETGKDFVVVTAIAGVQIKDLDISVEKEMMVIKGSRVNPHSHPEKKYFYQECYWGPFSKKVVLPENIDTKSAQAAIDKGILTITIPKLEA